MAMFLYSIENKVNGKRYIGQTMREPHARWWQHRSLLSRGVHVNRYLQNAWNKYGSDAFTFSVLREAKDTDELNRLEIWHIARNKDGYNLSRGGDRTTRGMKFDRTDEQKDRSAVRAKPDGYPTLCSPEGAPVSVVNAKRFSRENELRFSGVKQLMDGAILYYKGWRLWENREVEFDHNQNISQGRRPQGWPPLLSPDGTTYRIETTLTKFCKQHGLSAGCLSETINGIKLSHKGWTVQPQTEN